MDSDPEKILILEGKIRNMEKTHEKQILELKKQVYFHKALTNEDRKTNESYHKIINIAKQSHEALLRKENEIFRLRQNEINLRNSLFVINNPHQINKQMSTSKISQNRASLTPEKFQSQIFFKKRNTLDLSKSISISPEKFKLKEKPESKENEENSLQKENEKLLQFIEEFKSDYVELNIQLGQLTSENEALKQENEINKCENSMLREKLEFYKNFESTQSLDLFHQLEKQAVSNEERIQVLMSQLDEMTSLFEAQKEEYDKMKSQHSEVEQMKECLEERNLQMQLKEEMLLEKLSTLDEKLKQEEQLANTFKSENFDFHKKSCTEKDSLLNEIACHKKNELEAQKNIEKIKMLEQNLAEKETTYEFKIQEKNKKIFELEKQNSDSKKRLMVLAVQIAIANNKNESIQKKHDLLQSTIQELTLKISFWEEKFRNYKKTSKEKKRKEREKNNELIEEMKKLEIYDQKTDEKKSPNKYGKNKLVESISILEENELKASGFCDSSVIDNNEFGNKLIQENNDLIHKLEKSTQKLEILNKFQHDLEIENVNLKTKILDDLEIINEVQLLKREVKVKEFLEENCKCLREENELLRNEVEDLGKKNRENLLTNEEKIKKLEMHILTEKETKNNNCCYSAKGNCQIY